MVLIELNRYSWHPYTKGISLNNIQFILDESSAELVLCLCIASSTVKKIKSFVTAHYNINQPAMNTECSKRNLDVSLFSNPSSIEDDLTSYQNNVLY